MEGIMFEEHKQLFFNYVNQYDCSDNRVHLKLVHTMAVVDVMQELCKRLSLSPMQCEIAALCALYHDIGRFEQLKRYHTFFDHISIDHADLGCQILEENQFLCSLPVCQQTQILTAIRNHNKFVIEDGLDSDTLLFSKLIRDADKCDIFRVFATEDMISVCNAAEKEVAKQTISPEVYHSIFEHHCVLREYRKTALDIWISFLAFFYDLYFPESIEILMEQQYYRIPFDRVTFTNPKTKEQISQILVEVENYIKQRLK